MATSSIIETRLNNGFDQSGNINRLDGRQYFEYINYICVDKLDQLEQLSRWQRKYFSDGKGGRLAPSCLRLFTGYDRFGENVMLILDALTESENTGDSVALCFQPLKKPRTSRVLGGYHAEADVEGFTCPGKL